MVDPLALVTLAVAAAGGRWDGRDVGPLIAAGHTLLQRSAVLVRALATTRSAILMPPGSAVLTALAASDGRGALLLDPAIDVGELRLLLEQENVGAVFVLGTSSAEGALADQVVVDLSDAPHRAKVRANGTERVIDLGSHFGLDLVGDTATEGRDEPFVFVENAWHSHREILSAARHYAEDEKFTPMHEIETDARWSTANLVRVLAVLLQGGAVTGRS